MSNFLKVDRHISKKEDLDDNSWRTYSAGSKKFRLHDAWMRKPGACWLHQVDSWARGGGEGGGGEGVEGGERQSRGGVKSRRWLPMRTGISRFGKTRREKGEIKRSGWITKCWRQYSCSAPLLLAPCHKHRQTLLASVCNLYFIASFCGNIANFFFHCKSYKTA